MDFDERLIEEVRKREFIYNKRMKLYRNIIVRDKAWAEIAAALGAKDETCKTRWKSLRDRFCKVNKKIPSGSSSEPKDSSWEQYERMMFLKEHVAPRNTSSNYCSQEDSSVEILENILISPPAEVPYAEYESADENQAVNENNISDLPQLIVESDTPSSSTAHRDQRRGMPKRRKKAYQDAVEDRFSSFLTTMEKITEKRFSAKLDDGFQQFLCSKLDLLPPKMKEDTKMEIIQLVHDKLAQLRNA